MPASPRRRQRRFRRRPARPRVRNTVILTDSSRMNLQTALGATTLAAKLSTLSPGCSSVHGSRRRRQRRSDRPRPERSGGRARRAARTPRTSSRTAIGRSSTAYRSCPDQLRRRRRRRLRDPVLPLSRTRRCSGTSPCTCRPSPTTRASQASLRLGFVLNQDGYGSSGSLTLHGNAFPCPTSPVGRLVETPAEIGGHARRLHEPHRRRRAAPDVVPRDGLRLPAGRR